MAKTKIKVNRLPHAEALKYSVPCEKIKTNEKVFKLVDGVVQLVDETPIDSTLCVTDFSYKTLVKVGATDLISNQVKLSGSEFAVADTLSQLDNITSKFIKENETKITEDN